MNPLRLILLSTLSLALAACGGAAPADVAASGGGSPPTSGAAGADAAPAPVGQEEARILFDSLCSTCHGKDGKGDGPGGAALDPKPRAFTDAAWQDSVDDTHIQQVIVYGGAAVGKSAMMPANPQLKGKSETLAALVKIVRAFRGK